MKKANNYGWLDVVAASAVDKTDIDDDGNLVPAADFTSSGLRPIVDWVLRGLDAPTCRTSGPAMSKNVQASPQGQVRLAPNPEKRNILGYYFGCFAKYATFRGRVCRKEYWGFFLFNFLAALALSAVSEGVLGGLYVLAAFLPGTAVFILCLRGTSGDNDYGPDPLQM